jgi:hypothetical protein
VLGDVALPARDAGEDVIRAALEVAIRTNVGTPLRVTLTRRNRPPVRFSH